MNKSKAIKFWESLRDNTNTGDVIAMFENKKGYGGKRTLERWVRADQGFRQNLSSENIAKKAGWTAKYIEKIRAWWQSKFAAEAVSEPEPEVKIPVKQAENINPGVIFKTQGKYHEEWDHFEKIKEAIIKLQYASLEEALELFDEIERERVTLDDEDIQRRLTALIALERKMQKFGDKIPPELVAKLIDLLSRRMHKRYKRR